MLSSSIDLENTNVPLLLRHLANPLTHINPASVSLMLNLNTPASMLRKLEVSAFEWGAHNARSDADLLERIWEHRNYPREEYFASVRRAVKSKSRNIRALAARQRNLPDELLFEFAASNDPVMATRSLRTLKDLLSSLRHGGGRWAADSPQVQAERNDRITALAAAAWKSDDARIKQSVLWLAEELDREFLFSLADELLETLPPTSIGTEMDEHRINLYVSAALSRCRPGSPVSEEAWAHIGNLIAAISGPAGLGRSMPWYHEWISYAGMPDLHEALRFSIRDGRQGTYTNNYELLYNGIDPSALAIPQHVIDAVLSSKVPSLLEALASNPHLGHEATRKLIELDSTGSLTMAIARCSSDPTVLRELFTKNVELAKLVAENSYAPRDLLLAVAAAKKTYDEGPHKGVGEDEFGSKNLSTYEMVMNNIGLGGMTLAELEEFRTARWVDGLPRSPRQIDEDAKVLHAVAVRTSDPRVMQLAVELEPNVWLSTLDLPNLPADMRKSFITAASTGDGKPLGLNDNRLSSIIQNWFAHTKTVSNDELWSLAGSPVSWTRVRVAKYKNTPADLLEYLSMDKDEKVLSAVLSHKNTPASVIDHLVANPPLPLFLAGVHGPPGLATAAARTDLSQDSAWTLAADKNVKVRVGLADKITDIELIRLLASDSADTVRAAVANNKSVPLDLLLSLAKDESAHVRLYAATNPILPANVLLEMLKDKDPVVVKYVIAACYERGISVPTEDLAALFEHPGILENYVRRGRDRSWWWNQGVADPGRRSPDSDSLDTDLSPLAFAGQMLNYEDPKVLELFGKLLDAGSFSADPDMHECVSRLLNRPLPLRLQPLVEQRQLNTKASGPVEGLDDLGDATIPYPVEGFRAELTERLASVSTTAVAGYGRLVPRIIESPAAQRRNGNYMGNCTFAYHGPGTAKGYKIVVGFYKEDSTDPVLNALLGHTSKGWEISEVNNRFNDGVARATAESVAAILDLPLGEYKYRA
jgi:hypothetical protein